MNPILLVGFSKNSIGVFIYSVGYAKVKFQFLKHGTDEALPISGHGTIRGIDAGQGVRIPRIADWTVRMF